jgi:carboxyl-terminal processing protease
MHPTHEQGKQKGLLSAVLFGLVIAGASFGAGLYVGKGSSVLASPIPLLGVADTVPPAVDLGPLWKAWSILDEKFVPSSTSTVATDEEKVWGMIQGLASSYGDPYTLFFPPAESKAFEEEISGNFEGVGMEIDVKDEQLTVVSPLKGSPAEKAGMRAGDMILLINGEPSKGLTVENAVRKIRGPKGSVVVLSVVRDGKPIEISITRDVIQVPTIETRGVTKEGEEVASGTGMRSDGVFVIQLYNFSANSIFDFRTALREFIESGSHKLVLDLRGNPGGYLEAAVDMASWFLPLGKVIVREDYAGNRDPDEFRSKGYDVFGDDLKMVILINKGSASASEILAGALREHGVATIVGETSFGKGSVQELVPITAGTSLKVTVARWLTPNGVSISDQGIVPDHEVKFTQEDLEAGKDPQFDKAVEVLNL